MIHYYILYSYLNLNKLFIDNIEQMNNSKENLVTTSFEGVDETKLNRPSKCSDVLCV